MNCAGVIVFLQTCSRLETILVKTPQGHWGFPKGKKNRGEQDIVTGLRELYEETGITRNDIEFAIDECGNYIKFVENKIIYFVARYSSEKEHVATFDKNELAAVEWLQVEHPLKMIDFEFKPSRKIILRDATTAFKGCTSFVKYKDSTDDIKYENEKSKDKISDEARLSKLLTWILRHKAIDFGLKVDPDGYVLLDDLLKLDKMKGVTLEQVKKVVENNDKQRFALTEKNSQLYIRANQGHNKRVGSLINDKQLLKKITKPYDICFHGTYKKNIPLIQKTGLKTMNRKHIHLTNSVTAKSGIRYNANALVFINMERAIDDGIEFFESDNGVILTEGKDGCIDPKYISEIKYKG